MTSTAGADDELPEVVDGLREELAAMRRSRRRLADAAAADRRAIERELHDGVQQHLVALAVNLQRLAALMDADPGAANVLLGEIAVHVQEALDDATALARTIQPPLFDGRGLAGAIRWAAERAGVSVEIDLQASVRYPPEVLAAVYWTCVDTLTSATAGSAASVRVHEVDGGLGVEILIAGSFADDRLERLRDRVEALDGRVGVEGRPGGGTRVQGWLPASG